MITSIRSLSFTLNVQTKQNQTTRIYSLSVARLPGEIQPQRCSIKVLLFQINLISRKKILFFF
jgi:hypothetical protein